MNIKCLEALRAFMEGGSINAAAERLHRTPSQVSRLLAALEDDAGFALFTREGRRLVATDQARAFYVQVERALSSLDEVGHAARRVRDQQQRHVRILTAPHITDSLIADAVAVVARDDARFTASIDSRSRIDIELWLGKEQFDLGITVLPLDSPTIEIEPLVSVAAVAVMAQDHPLAGRDRVRVTDLLAAPFIATSPRSVLRQRLDATFRKAGVVPSIRFETPNGLIACQLAARGIGITVADGFVAHSSSRPGIVTRPFEPTIELRYVFLFPKWRPRSATVTRLAALIRASAHQTLAAATSTHSRATEPPGSQGNEAEQAMSTSPPTHGHA